jgi:cytoskeletal protein CcmA (bactofilin family)
MPSRIGETIFLKGHLSAGEDLQVAGRIEGHVELAEHVLTVQPTAELRAEVMAKSVVVEGAIRGDIVAAANICLQHTASVSGKIAAPKIAIREGADFNGRVETPMA